MNRRSLAGLWVIAPAVVAGAALLACSAAVAPEPAAAAPAELLDPTALRSLALNFRDADWEAALAQAATGDDYIHADLDADGKHLVDVGVRIKGNSSSRAPGRKKPLNLGLDAFVAGQRLGGYDTFNLNNMFADPTLVREVLTYTVLRPYLPVPRATFARVDANGSYFGLYSLVQQIEKTYLKDWFPSSGGYLFKADPPAGFGPQPRLAAAPDQAGRGPSDLSWLGEDLARYQTAYELKTTEAGDEAWVALRELTRVLDAPVGQGGVADAELPAAAERQFDVDGALWYVAANNLLANFDNYYSGHNYYLYRSTEDGRFHILSWDMNESFGVFRTPVGTPITSEAVAQVDPFLAVSGTATGRPILRRLLALPRYRADYLAHYRTLLARAMDVPALTAEAGRLQDLIRAAATADPNPLYGHDLFERGLWEDLSLGGGGAGGRPVPGLLRLAGLRASYLAGRADLTAPDLTLLRHERGPDPARAGEPVQVAIQVQGRDMPARMTLVYRVDGGAPVAVEMSPGDVTDLATLPGQPAKAELRYYVRAELADGRSVFFPEANWTQPWSYVVQGQPLPSGSGPLVLNELQADNKTTIADPAGDFDDWVELYNRGDAPVRLADYALSDDPAEPQRFRLPDETLAPGGYYLVWCDSDGKQGTDHAPFKLSKEGDAVYLSSATATVDSVTFGAQETDHSFGREAGGTPNEGTWVDCASPSPRAANLCGPVVATPSPAPSPTPGPTPTFTTHLYLPWSGRGAR